MDAGGGVDGGIRGWKEDAVGILTMIFVTKSSACFPSSAKVPLENGRSVSIDELHVGDRIQTGKKKLGKDLSRRQSAESFEICNTYCPARMRWSKNQVTNQKETKEKVLIVRKSLIADRKGTNRSEHCQ